jgi:hypothetical protein
MALIFGILFLINTTALKAQNCPTSGTTVVSSNASENTYYPGTQATVSAGATSITLGPIGSGANFGNSPIAAGDIVLVIQMQGAQIQVPASVRTLYCKFEWSGKWNACNNLMAGTMEYRSY